MFTATLIDPATVNGTVRGNPVVINPLLELRPLRYNGTVRGGYDLAEVEVVGPLYAMQDAIGWLRYGIEIVNDYGTVTWVGYVHEVEITFGGMRYILSLDNMANSVRVLHSYRSADGTQVSALTDAVTDTQSVARYGTKELVYPLSDAEQEQAEALRDSLLAAMATPHASGEPDAEAPTATLRCRGWYYTLDWKHYSNPLGREENGDGKDTQPLGLGFTSSEVGFTIARTIHDMGGRFVNFPADTKIRVTGSASNNAHYTIEKAADEAATSLTATTIAFEETDDIVDGTARLGIITKGSMIKVTGSVANSGYHMIDGATETHLTTWVGYGPGAGAIVNEAAGPSITLAQGNHIVAKEGVAYNEGPGATVTVACYGQRVAQSFTLSSPAGWTAVKVGIKLGKVGNPDDNVTVSLHADASGQPAVLALASGTISATSVQADPAWLWAELGADVPLSTGVTYWIVAARAGANDWDDYYNVIVDEGLTYAGGTCKLWTGSTWQPRPVDADMAFRVWGAELTTSQIDTIAGEGEFVRGVRVEGSSGVRSNQYRDGTTTALEEINRLLDTGTDSAETMIGMMTNDQVLHVRRSPAKSAAAYLWSRDARLLSRYGHPIEAGVLVVGEYMDIDEIPPAIDAMAEFSPRFITESEYDVRAGTLTPTLGSRDPYNLSTRMA